MQKKRSLFSLAKDASFQGINKAYIFFRYRYPKLFLLVLSIFAAYFLFKNPTVVESLNSITRFGYVGVFLAGMLFAFGFSAPFAVGFFIALQPQNLAIAAFIGGIGALLSDLLIFKFIKVSFEEEFDSLKKERPIKKMEALIQNNLGYKISNYLMYFFAGFLIASPLPDEMGVTVLAGLTSIKTNILAVISFVLNTGGIYVIFLLSA